MKEETEPEIIHYKKEREILRSTRLYSKVVNYILGIIDTENFQKEILQIRKKFKIPEDGFIYKGTERDFGHSMFLATKKLNSKFGLSIEWRELIEDYVIYNKFFQPEHAETFEVIDLKNFTKESPLTKSASDFTEEDANYYILGSLAENLPIAILVPPFASERDILDYIKKIYKHSILPLKKKYAPGKAKIGRYKRRNESTRARNQFIYENRNLPIKKIRQKLAEEKIFLDDGHIGKIISNEIKRRKEV